MNKPVRRLLIIVGALLSAVLVSSLAVYLTVGRSSAQSSLPNPNGYDDLVQAARIVSRRLDDVDDLDLNVLHELIATNAETFATLRTGLTRQCAVPTDLAIANFATSSRDLVGLKDLAKLLSAEGRLARMENRPTDAARSYLDAVRLGTAMSQAGLVMDRLVGIACEAIGCVSLIKLLPELTCEQMRPVIAELQKINENTVPWRDVRENERRFMRAQLGKYPNPFKLAVDLWKARNAIRVSEERHDLAAAHLRLLATELALRCYRCENRRAPARLDELVPKYLQKAPLDPFSSRTLVYQAQGTNWILYSVGPDRVDDGGKPVKQISSAEYLMGVGLGSGDAYKPDKGDLLYNSPW